MNLCLEGFGEVNVGFNGERLVQSAEVSLHPISLYCCLGDQMFEPFWDAVCRLERCSFKVLALTLMVSLTIPAIQA